MVVAQSLVPVLMKKPEVHKFLRCAQQVPSWSSCRNCLTDALPRSRRGQSALPSLDDERRLYRAVQIPIVP
jgi:hypothetical protein